MFNGPDLKLIVLLWFGSKLVTPVEEQNVASIEISNRNSHQNPLKPRILGIIWHVKKGFEGLGMIPVDSANWQNDSSSNSGSKTGFVILEVCRIVEIEFGGTKPFFAYQIMSSTLGLHRISELLPHFSIDATFCSSERNQNQRFSPNSSDSFCSEIVAPGLLAGRMHSENVRIRSVWVFSWCITCHKTVLISFLKWSKSSSDICVTSFEPILFKTALQVRSGRFG